MRISEVFSNLNESVILWRGGGCRGGVVGAMVGVVGVVVV